MDLLDWLTVTQAADQLGISSVSVYRAIERGRLRVQQTPLGVLLDPVSVDEYGRTRRPVRQKGSRVA